MKPDRTAIARHAAFGAEIAADHFRKFPNARFTTGGLLALMRETLGPVAGDHGIGSRGLEPLARAAAAGFLRKWRRLARSTKSS